LNGFSWTQWKPRVTSRNFWRGKRRFQAQPLALKAPLEVHLSAAGVPWEIVTVFRVKAIAAGMRKKLSSMRQNTRRSSVSRGHSMQGAITPTVLRGYAALDGGKFALALGDVHIVNDPVIAQGANTASRCAWVLGEALLEDRQLDEAFCRETEERLWQAARAATEWTNATLQAPPPYVIELVGEAARNRALANELVDNFGAPERNWAIFGSPEGAPAFRAKHSAAGA
jgi:hypothetical protein